MNKNLEKLKEVDFKPLNPYDVKLLKRVLEDFEKQLIKRRTLMLKQILPYLFYLIGSIFFALGSIISILRK